MEYVDPARPKLANGTPCWVHKPQIALPHPQFEPLPDNLWRVRIMVGDLKGSDWASKIFPTDKLPLLLNIWRTDPEALLRFFTNP